MLTLATMSFIQSNNADSVSKPKLLFVCGRNKLRSPTAEAIYRNDPRLEVRAVGLSAKSNRQLRERDLLWADLVLVMEHGQKARIQAFYRDLEVLPRIEVLDIKDEFEYMDENLVDMLRSQIEYQLTHKFRL